MAEMTTKRKMYSGPENTHFAHQPPVRKPKRLVASLGLVVAPAVFGLAAFTGLVTPAAISAAPLAFVETGTPAQRVVEGRVVNKQDTPINGAVVYLKDTRSLSVKSYLTDENGRFHFGQLADGADYEVWAEQNGKRSSSKSISQFNSKLDIQFTLKIDL